MKSMIPYGITGLERVKNLKRAMNIFILLKRGIYWTD